MTQLKVDLMEQLVAKENKALAAEAEAAAMESKARDLRDQVVHLAHKAADLLRENQAVRARMLSASSLQGTSS